MAYRRAIDTGLAVLLQQRQYRILAIAAEGQVGCHGKAAVADRQHRIAGIVPGRASGTVGDRKKFRTQLPQLLPGLRQIGGALFSFGREEFKAQSLVGAHG